MESLATENLFLLEFLVDSLTMNSKCDCDAPPGETCVSFQFLDNSPLDICEADFSPKRDLRNDSGSVKTGKSCLFSLTPDQVVEATNVFDVTVNVVKKMKPGWLPEKVIVGSALISIANLFDELVQSVGLSNDCTPTAKTLKDVFEILNSTGDAVGKIGIYVRMSCFGKLIVTQFQMNLDDKSILFKDKEGQSMYRYKKAKKGRESMVDKAGFGDPGMGGGMPMGRPPPGRGGPCQPGCPTVSCFGGDTGGYNVNCPQVPCPPMGAMVPPQQPPPFPMGMPPGNFQAPCNECGNMPGGFNTPPPNFNPTPCNECGGMGGMPPPFPTGPPCLPPNSAGKPPCNECGLQHQPAAFPDESEGNYQEIGACMGNNALKIRVHKERNTVEQIEEEDDGEGCQCSSEKKKKPKECGPVNQALRIGPGDQNNPFSLKMTGCGQSPNGNVIINPPTCTMADGKQITEISDPDKEVFVLRIGKKTEIAGKKNNLELELCTPKGPDLKPRPKLETQEAQYDPNDCSGGKDKGKKGGKGKKGKKK